ncbi:MAG: DUF402 domain-containing protein [Desulfobacteraceae bacterium]|nr:DUF402 domain-containing protein [Desulfobacteraceae bacterium]
MEVTLKLRGIYSTALTKFFLENGLTIVEPSRPIMERFGNHGKFEFDKPVGVEITDMEDGQGIVLSGNPEPLAHVAELIRQAFFEAICRKGGRAFPNLIEFEFPYLTKSKLDEFRNRVVATLPDHHRLRLIDSDYVDDVETQTLLNHPDRRESISRNAAGRLIWDRLKKGKKIGIDHVKSNGRVISLSPGKIIGMNPEQGKLKLKRITSKGGTAYDGLNLPKKEGDYVISELREGNWFYKHAYFRRDGRLIGEYYNVNTLIELYPDKTRYVDLEIDVVRWPDGKVAVIDEEDLNRYFESGYLSWKLKDTALKTAYKLKRLLSISTFV